MVKYCVAAGCKSTSNDGISFFKFPSNPSLRQQWTRQVERTRDRWSGPSKHSVLCATHFTQDCFEPDSAIAATMGLNKRRRLRSNAVPTVFERPSGGSSACTSSGASRKRTAGAAVSLGATDSKSTTQTKKPRQAYEKRERDPG